MKNQRFKQLSLSLCAVFALLVSSLSICACAHHQENNRIEKSSCHAEIEMADGMTMEMTDAANSSDAFQTAFSENAHCNCLSPAPKVSPKSELVKIEKQAAEISSAIILTVKLIAQIPAANPANFDREFYFSDSAYNIKSPRAPPRV